MDKRIDMFRVISLLLLFVLPAQAEIYKWVDEKGNVHYGDKPVTNSEEVMVKEQTSIQPKMSKQDKDERRKRLLESFAEDRVAKKEEKRKLKKQKNKRNRQCNNAKDRLKNYRNSRNLYDLNEKGERVILSEKAKQQAIAKLAADINTHCK